MLRYSHINFVLICLLSSVIMQVPAQIWSMVLAALVNLVSLAFDVKKTSMIVLPPAVEMVSVQLVFRLH